jgi:hypothetical protein
MPGATDGPMMGSASGYGEWNGSAATSAYLPFTAQNNVTSGLGSFVSDAGTFILSETALDMHCWGENPVVTAKLQLNGQDRFSEREGSYFDVVQPWQHHTRSVDTGINVYSFALRPEEHQPSGSCNFSRIDNAVLQLVLSSGTVAGTATAKVRVYAVNYNVLRVMSGMAGVEDFFIHFFCNLEKWLKNIQGAEKQHATNNQALFVDNFGLAPVLIACC